MAVEEGKTTAHLDSPQLSPDLALEAARQSDDLGSLSDIPGRVEYVPLGEWRTAIMRRHGFDLDMRLANLLRAYLDDEEAAVTMASRLVGATGGETPVELVRRAIRSGARGCCDGRCWCHESVPRPKNDFSRSTGGDDIRVPVGHCQARHSSSDPWTLRWLLAKGFRLPTNPWVQLALLPGCVSVEQLRSVVEEVVLTPSTREDYPEALENKSLGGMPINCTLKMARYATEGPV
jgi:hypothetical protein